MLCMIGKQCSTMTDAQFSHVYIPQVVLPLLVAMSSEGRDWIVRREAIRALAVYCLRRQCAHHVVLLNGVEVLLNTIHDTTHACIEYDAGGGANGSANESGTPTSEIAHVCEHLALKALGMLLIYEELVVEIQARVQSDHRFDSLVALFGQWLGVAGWALLVGAAGWCCFC